jgi:hypothetical protein
MGYSELQRRRQTGPFKAFLHLVCIGFFFCHPQKFKKMLFGCKNTGQIPSNELLITREKSQDNFNI